MAIGFILGPRLNAAGRLADMRLGVECLLTEDPGRALQIAQQLDRPQPRTARNRVRHAGTSAGSARIASRSPTVPRPASPSSTRAGTRAWWAFFASRIKDTASAPPDDHLRHGDDGLQKVGRSIPGLHLRDALKVAERAPGLLIRFGGHAMAAGVTVNTENFEKFKELFAQVAGELLAPTDLTRTLETDGALEGGYISLETARLLENEDLRARASRRRCSSISRRSSSSACSRKNISSCACAKATRASRRSSSISAASRATAPAPPTVWRLTDCMGVETPDWIVDSSSESIPAKRGAGLRTDDGSALLLLLDDLDHAGGHIADPPMHVVLRRPLAPSSCSRTWRRSRRWPASRRCGWRAASPA